MGEAFIETLIDGFENDIDFRPEASVRFVQSPEILATPPLESVPHNGGADFTGGGDTESNLAGIQGAVIEQEPVRRPVTPA